MIRHQVIGAGIILGIIGGLFIDSWMTAYPSTIVYAKEPDPPQVIQIATRINWTPERIDREIDTQAEKYNVSAETMRKVIQCESTGSTTIQSHWVKNGEREESYGLVQIHLPSHPHVTLEEAQDPKFAIEFLAKHLAQGQGKLWTCFRMI